MYNGTEAKKNEKFLFDGEREKNPALSCHLEMASLTFSGCNREVLLLLVGFFLHVLRLEISQWSNAPDRDQFPNWFTTIRHAGRG